MSFFIRKLFRKIWYRHAYLKSTAWQDTREYVFKKHGKYCSWRNCKVYPRFLDCHHQDYKGLPDPRLWHFFFPSLLTGVDKVSSIVPLCRKHHQITEWNKSK